jgi:hypothetical protein
VGAIDLLETVPHFGDLEYATNAVFILQIPGASEPFRPRLRSILVHQQPVTHARWNPVKAGSLALTCGTSALYIWSNEWINDDGGLEEMAECVSVPAGGLAESCSEVGCLNSCSSIYSARRSMVAGWENNGVDGQGPVLLCNGSRGARG